MELPTTLPQTDFDGIARALRHLRYVSQNASLKLDQPERYELGQAVKLLRGLIIAKSEPSAPAWLSGPGGVDTYSAAAIDHYLTTAPDRNEDNRPSEFVQPSAPWYLGLDGALYDVPDFPAVDIDSIPL